MTTGPEIVEVWPLDGSAHQVVWGIDGWGCSCGAGRTWPSVRSATTGKRASSLHVYWVRRRVWALRVAAAALDVARRRPRRYVMDPLLDEGTGPPAPGTTSANGPVVAE